MSMRGRRPRILVTAGPTHEPLDPVRYLANRSTGHLGYALARVAARRGYPVTLISGPTALRPPVHRCLAVVTTRQLAAALRREFPNCDWLFMTAAVADFRPQRLHRAKIKRGSAPTRRLTLVRNPDLLASVARTKGRRLVVGWALETGPLARAARAARAKLLTKQLDLVVAHRATPAGAPFGPQPVRALLIDRTGRVTRLPSLPKERLAAILLDKAEALWYRGANVTQTARCC